jgi:chromosome segregation ATPase
MQRVRTAVKDLIRVELVLVEADSDRRAFENRNRDIIRVLDEKREEVRTLQAEKKRLFALYSRYHSQYQDIINDIDEDTRRIHQEIVERVPKPDLDELDAEITSTRQRIELVSPGNPRVLGEYQRRARKIEEHAAELARAEAEAEELGRRVAEIRGRWEPRLDRLVARISAAFAYNFEQIRCAGQVSVHKDEEDFEKWSILIHVKFRCVPRLAIPCPPL